MNAIYCNTHDLLQKNLKAGDAILLSGTVYTARDAAHKKIAQALREGALLPFPLSESVIYYAGPTPATHNLPIGSCGPTTSSRMDPYIPLLFENGLRITIGKGDRSTVVYDTIRRYKGLYLCAIGGVGALAASCIKSAEIIAYGELGCESVKRLTIENLPLFVGIDKEGNSIFGGQL